MELKAGHGVRGRDLLPGDRRHLGRAHRGGGDRDAEAAPRSSRSSRPTSCRSPTATSHAPGRGLRCCRDASLAGPPARERPGGERPRREHRRRPDHGGAAAIPGRRLGLRRHPPARQGAPARHRQRALPHLPVAAARPGRRSRLHGLARPRALSVLDAPGPRGHLPRRRLRLRRDAAARRHHLRGLLLPPGRRQRERGGGHPGRARRGHPPRAGARRCTTGTVRPPAIARRPRTRRAGSAS